MKSISSFDWSSFKIIIHSLIFSLLELKLNVVLHLFTNYNLKSFFTHGEQWTLGVDIPNIVTYIKKTLIAFSNVEKLETKLRFLVLNGLLSVSVWCSCLLLIFH